MVVADKSSRVVGRDMRYDSDKSRQAEKMGLCLWSSTCILHTGMKPSDNDIDKNFLFNAFHVENNIRHIHTAKSSNCGYGAKTEYATELGSNMISKVCLVGPLWTVRVRCCSPWPRSHPKPKHPTSRTEHRICGQMHQVENQN